MDCADLWHVVYTSFALCFCICMFGGFVGLMTLFRSCIRLFIGGGFV